MVDTAEGLPLLRVPEPEDLVPEEEAGEIRTFPDHVHAQLFDEEPLGLGPVADANVDAIEPEETELSRSGAARHDRPTPSPSISARSGPAVTGTEVPRVEGDRQHGYP